MSLLGRCEGARPIFWQKLVAKLNAMSQSFIHVAHLPHRKNSIFSFVFLLIMNEEASVDSEICRDESDFDLARRAICESSETTRKRIYESSRG